ncbi:MAG: enoyl-CoA hydratase-related protein [Bacteroidota bacterium]|nr:enoyl-CoA hydratase-related protein [Bacteroidota bacterium]
MSVIKSEIDGIWVLTIDRESSMNAINKQIMSDLKDFVQSAESSPETIKGIVITGKGVKAFAAGADISEFKNLNEIEGRCLSEEGQAVFNQLEQLPFPVIAAINGFALGGGCELAMACHLRIAGSHAKFGQPEVNLALIPGFGGTQRLIRLVGRGKALELLMTGDLIDAQEALRIGLVNHIVEPGQEIEKSIALIEKIATKGPLAIAEIIKCTNAYFEGNSGVFNIESDRFGRLIASADATEGVDAFLSKRKPTFNRN